MPAQTQIQDTAAPPALEQACAAAPAAKAGSTNRFKQLPTVFNS
jgi:hypothetical protein